MAGLLLGIDTGGTYTDAVLISEVGNGPDRIVASAKALTTRHDLAVGIGEALDAVFAEESVGPDEVELVSISTTLATNAIVEGRGDTVCLVAIGFETTDLERAGLADAIGSDPVIVVGGGHDAQGNERQPLDADALQRGLAELSTTVSGFAIVSRFAVRNRGHELAARQLIEQHTDRPTTCSHELTAKLNGPKRALTCVLNARLIGLVGDLLDAAGSLLDERGISCPRMVVRGDGSLVTMAFARRRPIETILSGPAASVVGANHLSGAGAAVVADIGGTTTDVAVLREGQPEIDTNGALVGGHQTMVEAVAVSTSGLGGDSRLSVDDRSGTTRLVLGPQRVIPVSMLAADHAAVVHRSLDRQLATGTPRASDAQFGVLIRPREQPVDDPMTMDVMARLVEGVVPLDELAPTRRHELALDKLVQSGVAARSGFTPTDACHVLGLHRAFDGEAARKSATLAARQKDRHGYETAAGPDALARAVFDLVVWSSRDRLLASCLAVDGLDGRGLEEHPLIRRALDPQEGRLVDLSLRLSVPVVAIGASAGTYYPAVGHQLGTPTIVPEGGEVANAVGAVVGQVRMRVTGSVTPLKNGSFRTLGPGAQRDFGKLEEAVAHLEAALRETVATQAEAQGVVEMEVSAVRTDTVAEVASTDVLLEVVLTATASGRPQFGSSGRVMSWS